MFTVPGSNVSKRILTPKYKSGILVAVQVNTVVMTSSPLLSQQEIGQNEEHCSEPTAMTSRRLQI